jgi:uncharacterized protein (DUF1015 family)
MMEVRAFKAFRFDAGVVGDVGSCVAPPYDIISAAQQEALYEKSKYNIVRIIKGKTTPSDNGQDNPYTRAAGYLNSWIKDGALKQDPAESIYGYVQEFELGGTHYRRLSFIASARLEEFGKMVRPHEQILTEPMLDRLNLKRATGARFGLVFMLYEDRENIADKIIEKAAGGPALIDFVDEQDVRHQLFAITDKGDVEAIAAMMSDKSCIIADGHHRYTTGLTYSNECGTPASKYQMLAFTNTCHEGLIVLATHRLVGNLAEFETGRLVDGLKGDFEVTEFAFSQEAGSKAEARAHMLLRMEAEHAADRNAFGIYGGDGRFYVAVLKDKRLMDSAVPNMSAAWRELDVSVLHKLILERLLGIGEEKLARGENLEYVKDTPNAIDESIARVDAGEKQAAFFMNPVKMEQLKNVTEAGERMPQKSTYFFPKMYTGLTINKL